MSRNLRRLALFLFATVTSVFLVASPAVAGGQGFARSGVLPLDRALSPSRFAGVRVGMIELPEPDELSGCDWGASATNDLVRDVADLYAPLIPKGQLAAYEYAVPIAVVLQGANVNKGQYSILGKVLAQLGFITVIPNSFQTFGGEDVLFSDVQVLPRAITAVACEAAEPDSPIYGIADTDTVGAVGHSLGGAAALYAAADVCVFGFCEGGFFTRPEGLKAVAVYGTNLVVPSPPAPPPPAPPIVTQLPYDGSIPIAFLAGSLDGISTPDETAATYDTVPPVKSHVSIIGTNHYGINDENNPVPLPQVDNSEPALPQRRGARRIAQTIALWLRWHLTDDPLAEYWYTTMKASLDGVVDVTGLELVDDQQ